MSNRNNRNSYYSVQRQGFSPYNAQYQIERAAEERGHLQRTKKAGLGGLVGGMIGSFAGPLGAALGAALGAGLGANIGDDEDSG